RRRLLHVLSGTARRPGCFHRLPARRLRLGAEAKVSRSLGGLLTALATFAALNAIDSAAHAQGVDEFGGYGSARGEQAQSKQEAAFELRIGRYVPEVDSGV